VSNPYGATATAYHAPYYGTAAVYPAYHPPTTVNVYGSGCYNCGGWSTAGAAAAGAVVGMAVGAAAASANTAAATSNAYTSGYVAGSTNTANTASAYNAGVATGAASAATAYNAGVATGAASAAGGGAPIAYASNAIYPTLPPGSMAINKNGNTYYLNGNTWFQPAYGANGVYYRVVPTP
jgi:hypothetical protein